MDWKPVNGFLMGFIIGVFILSILISIIGLSFGLI